MVSKKGKIIALILVFCMFGELPMIAGHGYLAGPRSRNAVANEDGKWYDPDPNADYPMPESCPHCLNRGGVCGTTQDTFRSYDTVKDMHGNPMEPKIQAIYTEGQVIDVEFIITAHHKGHIQLSVCPDANMLKQECFDAHPLTFLQDVFYGAPKDVNNPERGYIAPNDGTAFSDYTTETSPFGGMFFRMKFKLPDGVTCEHCLLQWRYITGNSCQMYGYDKYPFPSAAWHMGQYAPDCPNPFPADSTKAPERFANCADIKIVSGAGSGASSNQMGGFTADPDPVITNTADPDPVMTQTNDPDPVITQTNDPDSIMTQTTDPDPIMTQTTDDANPSTTMGPGKWKRCGGMNHAPCYDNVACETCRDPGFVCTHHNEWHWQCDKDKGNNGAGHTGNTGNTNQDQASSFAVVEDGEYPKVGKWKRCGGLNHECKANKACAKCKHKNFECVSKNNKWHWQCNKKKP